MVQVTLRLRPKSGYHYTNKIKTFTLDSSSRLEELLVVSGENGGAGGGGNNSSSSSSSSKSSSLYSQSGQELALNTSIASHNFENNELIETCKSPYMSAALTSVLKDIEQIKKQIPTLQNNENEVKELLFRKLQFAPDNICVEGYWDDKQWNHERVKTRTICLATMKKVLQRDDRYQVFDIPSCQTIHELYQHMESTWDEMGQRNIDINDHNGSNSTTSGRRSATRVAPNRMKYLLSSKTKKTGLPSTLWILIERKLEIQNEIRDRLRMSGSTLDPLEEFIRLDDLRHESSHSDTRNTSFTTSSSSSTASTRRRRRNEDNQNDINSNIDGNTTTPSTTTRTNTTSRQSKYYIPEYSSGPFAILATLFEAMDPSQSDDPNMRQQRRELSLTESKLKHKAQRRCRSNLYDRGIGRGHRSAFACMEGLANKELVRKEVGNFGTENGVNIEKWSLLTKGEKLGSDCLAFQKAVNQVLPIKFGQNMATNSKEQRQRQRQENNDIVLVVDNREDPLFRDRLKMYCDDDKVPFEERELPSGDYLFVTRDEKVIPLVIERKSWSDFADSVMGRGKANRRLDCVSIRDSASSRPGSIEQQYMQWQQDPHCARRNCQLCKMKRSGCSQIMFIIEGSWCAGRDDTNRNKNKCTREKRCQSCKALMERHHGVTDEMLQKVLHRLQVQHGCHVHFTNSYNETITSLFMIRKLLMEENSYASAAFDKNNSTNDSGDDDLNRAIAMSLNQDFATAVPQPFTYGEFLANTRSSNLDSTAKHNFNVRKKQGVVNFAVQSFVRSIVNDEDTWRQTVCKSILGDGINPTVANNSNESGVQLQSNRHELQTNNNVDISNDEIQILDDQRNNVVDLNESNDSDNSIECIDLQESQNPIIIDIDESQVSLIDMNDDESESDGTIDLIDSSNDRNIVESVVEDESNTVRTVAPINSNLQALNGTPLVVLQQMQSYNERFMKDLHKVWKNLYSQKMDSQRDTNIADTNIDIFARSTEDLQNLKLNEAFPLIRREQFLFATLYVQIKLGVILRIASKNEYANEIMQLWTYSSQADARVPHNTSIHSAESSKNVLTDQSRQRSQNVAPQRERNASTASADRSTDTPVQSSSSKSNSSREQRTERKRGNQRDKTTAAVTEDVRTTAEPIRTAAVVADETTSITTMDRITKPSNMSSHRAKLIEARLRRFQKDQPKKKSSQTNTQRNAIKIESRSASGWTCSKCTLDNPMDALRCNACDTKRPTKLTPQQSNVATSTPILRNTTSSTTSTSRTSWNCRRCTFANPLDRFKCAECDFGKFEDIKPNVRPNTSTSYQSYTSYQDFHQHSGHHSTNNLDLESTSSSQRSIQQQTRAYSNNISSASINIPNTLSSGSYFNDDNICTTTTNKYNTTPDNRKIARVKRCGACGNTGHTRSNATPENCTAYNDDAEVQRRLQKERKIQEKATRAEQELREAEASYKTKEDDNEASLRQMERIMEEHRKSNEATKKLREDDLKRKRQAADRLKKRAEKRARY